MLSLAQTVAADTLKLTVKNNSSFNARVVVVWGGTLDTSSQIWGGQTKTFAITVPDGKCIVGLRVTTGTHGAFDRDPFNLCEYSGFTFGARRR